MNTSESAGRPDRETSSGRDGAEKLNSIDRRREKIRADKDIKDTPIIIISAMNDDEVKRRAHEAGATAYYEKPFSPLALLKEIESLQRRSGIFS